MTRRAGNSIRKTARRLMLLMVAGATTSVLYVYLSWIQRERRYNDLIAEIAPKYGVDALLIKAVMRQESKFDPFAHSSKGAIGLMQVTEAAGWDWAWATSRDDFGRDSLWNPRINIEAGAWYLARALQRWQTMDDPIPFSLAEYNAGLGNVQRWLPNGRASTAAEFTNAITYPSVRKYIEAVTRYYEQYQGSQGL